MFRSEKISGVTTFRPFTVAKSNGEFFKDITTIWKRYLRSKEETFLKSKMGQEEILLYNASRKSFKMYRGINKLQPNKIPQQINNKIQEIIRAIKSQDYKKSNDIYFQLSIGNSPVQAIGCYRSMNDQEIIESENWQIRSIT